MGAFIFYFLPAIVSSLLWYFMARWRGSWLLIGDDYIKPYTVTRLHILGHCALSWIPIVQYVLLVYQIVVILLTMKIFQKGTRSIGSWLDSPINKQPPRNR